MIILDHDSMLSFIRMNLFFLTALLQIYHVRVIEDATAVSRDGCQAGDDPYYRCFVRGNAINWYDNNYQN